LRASFCLFDAQDGLLHDCMLPAGWLASSGPQTDDTAVQGSAQADQPQPEQPLVGERPEFQAQAPSTNPSSGGRLRSLAEIFGVETVGGASPAVASDIASPDAAAVTQLRAALVPRPSPRPVGSAATTTTQPQDSTAKSRPGDRLVSATYGYAAISGRIPTDNQVAAPQLLPHCLFQPGEMYQPEVRVGSGCSGRDCVSGYGDVCSLLEKCGPLLLRVYMCRT
jgi:hypothetical protein